MSRSVSANVIEARPDSWTTTRRPDMERLFRAARRHSRLVRIVRIVLPTAIAAGLAALVVVHYLDPLRMLERLPTVSGKLAVSGSKITMEAPRIAGVTRDARSYELTAETAVQDILHPDVVDLRNVHASVELPDQNMVQITAASGIYNTKADQIVLRDRVMFVTAHGYRGRLREASVDVKKGNIVSEQPVEVTLPDGLITANRLEILDSGGVVRFDGGVVLTIQSGTPIVEAPAR